MARRILYFLIVCFLVLDAGEANKCDEGVLQKINQRWRGHVPTGIIDTFIRNGKEVGVSSTKSYYPADTKCSYVAYHPEKFTYTLYYNNGSWITIDDFITEKPGVLLDQKTTIKRYIVMMEGGVTAWYKCSDDGPEGPAEGGIKVRACKYNRATLNLAHEALRCVGISITEEYPDKCP